jgi:hypothetical protein
MEWFSFLAGAGVGIVAGVVLFWLFITAVGG